MTRKYSVYSFIQEPSITLLKAGAVLPSGTKKPILPEPPNGIWRPEPPITWSPKITTVTQAVPISDPGGLPPSSRQVTVTECEPGGSSMLKVLAAPLGVMPTVAPSIATWKISSAALPQSVTVT